MKRILMLSFVFGLAFSCSKKNENVQVVPIGKDSVAIKKIDSLGQKPVAVETTKININLKGPLYESEDGSYRFRIVKNLEKITPQKILLKNEYSGRIYDMERVRTVTGKRYQDFDGYFFRLKDDSFYFGKNKELVASGVLVKSDSLPSKSTNPSTADSLSVAKDSL